MEGHKLDMRFFVLLRRSGPQPLAYLSHAFVVRIANLPYGLNNFHEYQRCALSMALLSSSSSAAEGPGHPGSQRWTRVARLAYTCMPRNLLACWTDRGGMCVAGIVPSWAIGQA